MWLVTCYAWHMTSDTGLDTWHMTRDTWHLTSDNWRGVNILSKFQLPSSYGLGVLMFWRFGGKGRVTRLMNDKGVYRTAPTTPGLLISIYMYLCEENLLYDIMITIQVKKYVTLSHVKFGDIVHHPLCVTCKIFFDTLKCPISVTQEKKLEYKMCFYWKIFNIKY